MGVKCPKCQHENPSDTVFCGKCGTRFPSAEMVEATETLEIPLEELTTGSTFAGRYKIIEELGKGGMGRVYKAHDTKINEKIALKLIKPEIAKNKKTIERFSDELRLARKIRHKNICGLFDLGEEKGTHFITMEFIPGEDLRNSIRRFGKLPVEKSISIAKQICEGLADAHKLRIVHRDLKPSNIMIDREGNARIMDFGIARSPESKDITGAGVMIGTPEYMSPEQAEGKGTDRRSDIYSLGVILYELVTGEVPFKGETSLSIAMKHSSEIPKEPKAVNPDIPDKLNRLILCCLEKKKEDRYDKAEELLIALEGITGPETQKFKTPQWKNSVAVLPFANMSGDPEQEYFCDGITEELINSLTQIKNLRVIARTSSFMFKDKHEDIREIGRKLNVETLLEGSVRKSGNRLRITAQLVDVMDGSHLWSDRFDREMEDVFKIQDEISLAICDNLKVKLLGTEKAGITKRHTENPEAYNLYLKGRYFWNRRTQEGLNRSLEFFQKSIDIDPEFALAYSGLASTYTLLALFDYLPPTVAYRKAKENVLKALEIDNTISEAHTAMARIKDFYDWDWIGAKKEFEQAIALNASDAEAFHMYSHFLTEIGHFDESIEAMKRALELGPLAIEINACLGMNLYLARRYDEAIEQLNKTIELDPHYYDSYGWLGMTYAQKENYQKAIEIFNKAGSFQEISNRMIAAQIYVQASAGNKSEAQKELERLIEISKKESVEPYFLAWAYAGLGQKDRAMEFLNKGCEARSCFMRLVIKVDPWFDDLRTDPRFAELLEKMGLKD